MKIIKAGTIVMDLTGLIPTTTIIGFHIDMEGEALLIYEGHETLFNLDPIALLGHKDTIVVLKMSEQETNQE